MYYKPSQREVMGGAFIVLLSALFILSVVIACFILGSPIILGSERNGNGSVEYLCLGAGCENYPRMDW